MERKWREHGKCDAFYQKYFGNNVKRDFIDLIVFIDRLKRQDFRILDGIPKVLIIAFNNESVVSPVSKSYMRAGIGNDRLLVCLSEYLP